ncbi:MAG TPA: hypothetical protein VLD63_08865, partial [Anaerolineales bacterium]|nr:hypothetical protein [Anaerolineales bacterium]
MPAPELLTDSDRRQRAVLTQPFVVQDPRSKVNRPMSVVGKPEPKVDAIKLVQGKPAFAADFEKRGLLVAKVLHSPYAH